MVFINNSKAIFFYQDTLNDAFDKNIIEKIEMYCILVPWGTLIKLNFCYAQLNVKYHTNIFKVGIAQLRSNYKYDLSGWKTFLFLIITQTFIYLFLFYLPLFYRNCILI